MESKTLELLEEEPELRPEFAKEITQLEKGKIISFESIEDMRPWFVYILECRDDSLYTGITNDLEKRMQAHKKGVGSKYVRAKRFKKILHAITTQDKSEALKTEYQIKQLERNDKITFFMQHPNLKF
jgi:putative endonuclease